MAIYNDPDLAEHAEEHQRLILMLKEELSIPARWSSSLPSMLPAWFGGHSFGYDREMTGYIIEARASYFST